MAREAVRKKGVPVALACRTFGISETCYRYEAKLSDENAEIADWLVRLAASDTTRRWGFGLCYLYLRNVMGSGRMKCGRWISWRTSSAMGDPSGH